MEALVAIGALASLALLATSGFGDYLRNCRRTATLNALAHGVHAARTVAASRGVTATLCGTLDGRSCSRIQDWSDTLLVLPGPATATTLDAVQVLRLEGAGARQTVRANRGAIEFEPLAPQATTATVTVCDDRGPPQARALIVSRTGRVRISERDAGGRLLACP